MLFASVVYGESKESEFFRVPKADLQWVLEELYNYDYCKDELGIKNREIANLKWEISVLQREAQIKDKETALAQKESEINKRAFDSQKEVTESWKKLAEASKPKLDLMNMLPLIAGVIIAIFSVVSK